MVLPIHNGGGRFFFNLFRQVGILNLKNFFIKPIYYAYIFTRLILRRDRQSLKLTVWVTNTQFH